MFPEIVTEEECEIKCIRERIRLAAKNGTDYLFALITRLM